MNKAIQKIKDQKVWRQEKRDSERGDVLALSSGLTVGKTIFSCEWGATMQLVDFYLLVGHPSECFVELVKLETKQVHGPDGMSGKVVPSDVRRGEVFKRKLTGTGVKITDYRYADVWSGKPLSFDHWD